MRDQIRKTGIDVIGDASWGTHFCQFYQTKEDLIDTLVPYFRAGLENNEFCMWVTAEPLNVEEAILSMTKEMPDFAKYLASGQIEILPYHEWYVKDGSFDSRRVLNAWVEKLNQALARGYDGLRLTGNTFWLEKKDWKSFAEYEAAVNNVIGKCQMLALCTYCLDKCNAREIMDVIRNHEFAIVKQEGSWERIENTRYEMAKQALAESEERYKTVVETANEGILISDPDGKIRYANPKMADMLGYTREELIKKNSLDLLAAGQKEIVLKTGTRLKRGARIQREFKFKHKNGSVLWTIASTCPLLDKQGHYLGNLAMHTDITGRKREEVKKQKLLEKVQQMTEELEASNKELQSTTEELRRANEELEERVRQRTQEIVSERQRLYSVLETLPAMICLLTPDYHVAFASRSFREKFGESHGRHCYEYCFGLTRPCQFCESYKVLETGKPHRWEVTTPDGMTIIDAYDFPFTDVDGSPLVLEMDIDITESKRTEAALKELNETLEQRVAVRTAELRESEARLMRSQEMAHLGSWELDLVNNRLSWSDEVYRIFGLKPQEFGATYEAFLEAVHPDDRAAVDAAYSGSLRGGKDSYEIEHRVVRKATGEIRHVNEKCQHVRDKSGKIIRSIGMVHDITERKQAEAALRESESNLQLLWNTMGHGVVYQDSQGKIVRMNPAAERILGKTPEQFLGKTSEDIEHECIRPDGSLFPGIEHPSMISLKTGQEIHGVVMGVYNPKEKAYRWINISAIPLFHSEGNKPYQVYTIFDDINELKKVEDTLAKSRNELAQANEQLKQYSQRITQVQEDERKRIAYELHDDTAQYLGILKMQIGALVNSEEIQNSKIKEKLQYLERDANRAFDEVRRYSHELRPVVLEHQGLAAALEQIADDYNKLGPLTIEVNLAGKEPELSEEVKLGFFRIAQEALNNTRKHAKANQATINLRFYQKQVWMTVSDDGIGFDANEALKKSRGKGNLGLMSMRERADMIRADLQIASELGKGTKVILKYNPAKRGLYIKTSIETGMLQ